MEWDYADIYDEAYNAGLDQDYDDSHYGTDWDGLVRSLEDSFNAELPEDWSDPILKKIKSEYRRGKRDGKEFQ